MELTIDYLDLAIPEVNRKVTRLDQFRHTGYCNNQFKHDFHSENPIQTQLQISLYL